MSGRRLTGSAELLRHVEQSCERKAAANVAASAAHQRMCAALQRARREADERLRAGLAAVNGAGELAGIARKSAALELQAARALEQRKRSDRGVLERVAAELAAFEAAQEDEKRRARQAVEDEQKARKREEEQREKVGCASR